MLDIDRTLSSPLSEGVKRGPPLLVLTIVWHPERRRIGEQFVGPDGAGELSLSRYLPLFYKLESEGGALEYSGVSRNPVRLVRDSADNIVVLPSPSRMVIELNGRRIYEAAYLTQKQVESGVILGLGGSVLLCIHWMRLLPKRNVTPGIHGVGDAAIRIRDQVRQAAATSAPVLLLGETGTGKEVAARAIHALSRRAAAALVSINMAAISESLAGADLFGAAKGAYTGAQTTRNGFFSEANGGTLFLDEIGNTPPNVQPMLLRVLETGEYRPLGATHDQISTARLIAATDQNLYAESFNQALLRRLGGFIIHIAPIRERREDIGVLIAAILDSNTALDGHKAILPTALVSKFANYNWPGNVRQLSHVLKRCLLMLQCGETPDFDVLVDRPMATHAFYTDSPPAGGARKRLSDIDEQAVLAAMENSGWGISAAAEQLNVSRPSMYKLLEAHPLIRKPAQIPLDEMCRTLEACAGDVEACASRLKTPFEAMRRHLRANGVLR